MERLMPGVRDGSEEMCIRDSSKAHWLAGGMVVFSFFVLLGLTLLNRHNERVMP